VNRKRKTSETGKWVFWNQWSEMAEINRGQGRDARIVGVVQLKGGAGRSTIATNLAAALSQDAVVALIDCDLPQGTSAAWGTLRKEIDFLGTLSVDTAMDYQ